MVSDETKKEAWDIFKQALRAYEGCLEAELGITEASEQVEFIIGERLESYKFEIKANNADIEKLQADLAAMERRAVAAEEDWQAAEEARDKAVGEADKHFQASNKLRNDLRLAECREEALRRVVAAAEAENERLREVVSAARLLRGALFIDPRNGKVDIAMDGQAIKAVENIDSAFAELDAGKTETEQPRTENTLDG